MVRPHDPLLGLSIRAGVSCSTVSRRHLQSLSAKVALQNLFIMRFSVIFTVLAAGAMAFAGAVPDIVVKRSNTDIVNAFNDLSDKCDTIIPKFDDCHDDTCSALICAELVVAIDECTAVLGGLTGGLGTLAVAHAVVDVVTVSDGQVP